MNVQATSRGGLKPHTATVNAELYRRCPVCESDRLKDRYEVSGFTITHCDDCDLLFVRERLSQDDLVAYYDAVDEDYIYNDPVNIENLKYYFLNVKPMIESRITGDTRRLLDIGCSAGLFLDLMEGWERHGIEFPSSAGRLAQSKHGDNIHLGTIESYDWQGHQNYFDCITLFDSFDHMLDPVGILSKCRSMLKPGGLLVVKVHDTGCLYAKLSGKSLYSIIPPYHMFFYTRRSLLHLLGKVGMNVVDVRHMAHIILLKTIPFRLAKSTEGTFMYRLFNLLDRHPIGNIRIKKNLHDLITTFSVKEG